MKKKYTAALAAALVLCASQAFAYDNPSGGYSVQDNDPFFRLATEKIYAYTSLTSQNMDKGKATNVVVNAVNYFDADDVEKITGEKFSNAYFSKEFDKLALLRRADLSMETIPTPILDLEKYAELEGYKNSIFSSKVYKDFKEKVKPQIILHTLDNGAKELRDGADLSKLKGQKAITLSYLYKQQEVVTALDMTFTAANDRLYILLTSGVIDEPKKDDKKDEEKATEQVKKHEVDELIIEDPNKEADTAANEQEPLFSKTADDETAMDDVQGAAYDAWSKAMQERPVFENADIKTLDKKSVKAYQKERAAFLKGFKNMTPAETPTQFGYYDNVLNKSMNLPHDWYYGQFQMNNNDAVGNLTIAASLKTAREIANDFDVDGLFGTFGFDVSANETSAEPKEAVKDEKPLTPEEKAKREEAVKAKAKEEMRKALDKFDVLLMTGSVKFNVNFNELLSMTGSMTQNRYMAEQFIESTLKDIQKMSNEYVALKSYSYDLDISNRKNSFELFADVEYFKEFLFKNLLKLDWAPDSGTAVFMTRKDGYKVDENLQKSLDEWQF